MTPTIYTKLVEFLKEELSLSSDSLAVVERSCEQNPGPLPMVLWKYGLVTLEELDRIYDWLEARPSEFLHKS
ncbi:MAG: DUF2949 domain-containing protein [Xenococcaceae cyanobacterium]